MFKPTLACDANVDLLKFPLYASPKLDGVRCSIVNGKALTRTLKAVPNRHIYEFLSNEVLSGLDGELVVGSPTADDAYRVTVSGVMSHGGEPEFTYHVFDDHRVQAGWLERFESLRASITDTGRICVLPHTLIQNHDDLMAYEAAQVDAGYEGVILRHPTAPYKYGRSTVKEGYLLKLKRFEDSEAEVIDIEEEMFNGNDATTNELGRTKRSTAKAGLVPKGRMGKLHVRDLKTGVEFHIGTGFNDTDKEQFWLNDYRGRVIKYKFFPVGMKDKPRHPVFLGFRDRRDM